MAFIFPTSPSIGDQYVAPTGRIYLWDGSWTTRGDAFETNPFEDNAFRYRSIYTRGYTSGGYKSSSPWKNTNRTQHATDISTNLGDQLDYAAAYIHGGYSDYNQYVYGTVDSFSGASKHTSSVSMVTETGRTHDTKWDLKTTRDDTGVLLTPSLSMAYITAGGSTSTDKHNYVTEVMYELGSAPAGYKSGTTYGQVACWNGPTIGWIYQSGAANFTYATESWISGGTSVGTDGWGKALSTKHGHAYVKNGGNIVTGAFKLNDTTGAQIRTDLNFDNSGEENYQTGQDWGYCIGHYNGAQNNNTYKVHSVTDVYSVLGADAQPKGHDGMSSAAMASGSSMILGGV